MMHRRASADCLDAKTIAEIAAGRLSPNALEKVRFHLPHCAACREAIATQAQPPSQSFLLTRRVSRSWPKWLAVAVSFGALGASGWWALRGSQPVPEANITVAQRLMPSAAPPGAAAAVTPPSIAATDEADAAATAGSASVHAQRHGALLRGAPADAGSGPGGAGLELGADAAVP